MDCATTTLVHPEKGAVQINAHESDSIDAWRKIGYVLESEIAKPEIVKPEIVKPEPKRKRVVHDIPR